MWLFCANRCGNLLKFIVPRKFSTKSILYLKVRSCPAQPSREPPLYYFTKKKNLTYAMLVRAKFAALHDAATTKFVYINHLAQLAHTNGQERRIKRGWGAWGITK